MYKHESFKFFYEITNFLNENHIKKENIIKIIDRNNDKDDFVYNYSLIYYEERA